METSRKARNYGEGKKKTVIKIGGGGGGIGAVILLGGALATAALASALAVRAGRSSAKDRGRNPPPVKKKLSEEDEEKERPEIVLSDDHLSEGAKKEVESDNGTEGFLGKTEINGRTPGDFEASDEILCSKNLEKDDGFFIVDEDPPSLEEKWPLECQNKMPEDEENTKFEKVYNEEDKGAEREKNDHGNGEIEVISCNDTVEVAENDVEVVQIDETEGEERESMVLNIENSVLEACSSVNGEISEEEKCVEVIERAKVDMSEDGIDQEAINNGDTKEVEEQEDEGVVQELESIVLHENVDGDEGEGALSSETVEIVQDDETNEEVRENVEEKLVEDEENVDGNDGESALISGTVEIVQEGGTIEEIIENVEEKLVDNEKNVEGDDVESALVSGTVEIAQEGETIEEVRENVEEKLVEDEENVDGDDGESVLVSGTVEIVQEGETIEELQQNVEEKLVEDKEKCAVPELETVVEHENVDDGESALFSGNVETVQDDETIEEIRENVEEKLAEGEEKCDGGIVLEKCEEVESIDGATQVDQLSNLIDKKDEEVLQMIDSEVTKELIISPKSVEIAKDNAGKEVSESLELKENHAIAQYPVSQKDDVEEKMIHCEKYEAAKDDINDQTDEITESEHKSSDEDDEDSVITTESSDDGEINDEITEESSVEAGDSSTESNSEAVWPAESAKAKIISYEVEGKILEDNQTNYHKKSARFFASEKSFINKYMAKRSMVIGMLSLLLSLSCSWYFDLSFVKLCVVLFLTMAVLEVHGY